MNIKRILKKVLVTTTVSCIALTTFSSAFTDLTPSHWGYNVVGEMVKSNVISGYNDGTFKPDKKVTRAEFATILVKALGEENNTVWIEFKDLEGIHWAEKFTENASKYMDYYTRNGKYYFEPEEPTLREDAAVAIVRAKGLENQKANLDILNQFSDSNKISENLKRYVAIAVENKLMNGNANKTFNPKGGLTRAEVAAVIYNTFVKEESKDITGNKTSELVECINDNKLFENPLMKMILFMSDLADYDVTASKISDNSIMINDKKYSIKDNILTIPVTNSEEGIMIYSIIDSVSVLNGKDVGILTEALDFSSNTNSSFLEEGLEAEDISIEKNGWEFTDIEEKTETEERDGMTITSTYSTGTFRIDISRMPII